MRRGDILRLLPCRHMLHSECTRPLFEYSENINCPICRTAVTGNEAYERKNYAKTSQRDRELIVECSNRGEDWTGLAKNLGVKYQTAYSWIRSGSTESKKRGGARPMILTSDHVNLILEWLEQDCSLSLVQIKAKLLRDCNIAISTSSVANYLEGQLFTTKQVYWQPITMNSVRNKELRKNYVTSLNNYVQGGNRIMWIDETNFNLFCRRSCGRSRQGTRARASRPASRGSVLIVYYLSEVNIIFTCTVQCTHSTCTLYDDKIINFHFPLQVLMSI